jgi:hypothetical protein
VSRPDSWRRFSPRPQSPCGLDKRPVPQRAFPGADQPRKFTAHSLKVPLTDRDSPSTVRLHLLDIQAGQRQTNLKASITGL